MKNFMTTHVKMRMQKWQCFPEDTKNLPFNVINGWEEETFGEIDFEMIHQETIKLLAMVVNSPNI